MATILEQLQQSQKLFENSISSQALNSTSYSLTTHAINDFLKVIQVKNEIFDVASTLHFSSIVALEKKLKEYRILVQETKENPDKVYEDTKAILSRLYGDSLSLQSKINMLEYNTSVIGDEAVSYQEHDDIEEIINKKNLYILKLNHIYEHYNRLELINERYINFLSNEIVSLKKLPKTKKQSINVENTATSNLSALSYKNKFIESYYKAYDATFKSKGAKLQAILIQIDSFKKQYNDTIMKIAKRYGERYISNIVSDMNKSCGNMSELLRDADRIVSSIIKFNIDFLNQSFKVVSSLKEADRRHTDKLKECENIKKELSKVMKNTISYLDMNESLIEIKCKILDNEYRLLKLKQQKEINEKFGVLSQMVVDARLRIEQAENIFNHEKGICNKIIRRVDSASNRDKFYSEKQALINSISLVNSSLSQINRIKAVIAKHDLNSNPEHIDSYIKNFPAHLRNLEYHLNDLTKYGGTKTDLIKILPKLEDNIIIDRLIKPR